MGWRAQGAPTLPQSSANPPASHRLLLQLDLHLPLCSGQGWSPELGPGTSTVTISKALFWPPSGMGGRSKPRGHCLGIKFSSFTPDSFLTC